MRWIIGLFPQADSHDLHCSQFFFLPLYDHEIKLNFLPIVEMYILLD